MNLKQYFRKLREIEAALPEEFPLMVSLDTADGGKAGVVSEVPRSLAAKLIVEGSASIASAEQAETFRAQQATARKAAEKAELAKRVQVAILSDPDLHSQANHTNSNGPSTTGK